MTRFAITMLAAICLLVPPAGSARADGEAVGGTKQTRRRLEAMANDPKLAEAALGAGYRVMRLAPTSLRVDHYDTADGSFGREGGALRVRTQKGAPRTAFLTAKVNGAPVTQQMRLPLYTTGGAHEFSPSSKPDPFVKTSTGGSHVQGYAILHGGEHVAQVDVGNHYTSAGGRRGGFGVVTYRPAPGGVHDHDKLSAILKVPASRRR